MSDLPSGGGKLLPVHNTVRRCIFLSGRLCDCLRRAESDAFIFIYFFFAISHNYRVLTRHSKYLAQLLWFMDFMYESTGVVILRGGTRSTKYRSQDASVFSQSSRNEERQESGGTDQVRTQKFLMGLGVGWLILKQCIICLVLKIMLQKTMS